MEENLIEYFTELKRNKKQKKETQNKEKRTASNWRQNAKYYYQIK